MNIAPIPIGSKLIDTVQHLGVLEITALRNAGVNGLIAYLGGNLTPALIAAAHQAGMGVVPVNYSHPPGWLPSKALGEVDASASTRRLAALAIPQEGLVDWCDLEGTGANPTEYLHAWSGIVADQGRLAGLYVGAGSLLTGSELYALPAYTRYWKSQSIHIPEPSCGFCMLQLYPTTHIGEVEVDIDYAQHDFEGRAGSWLVS